MTTLEPASAVAAAKCLTARLWVPGMGALDPGALHPRPCAWEDFTRDELAHLLADFNSEAGYNDRTNRYADQAVQRFRASPDQSRQVRAAQYPEEATR